MASVKIILRSRSNKDGTRPLLLQIIKDRKKSIISLGYHIKPSDWDPKAERVKNSFPNSGRLNNFLLAKKMDALSKVLAEETMLAPISAQKLKESVKQKVIATFKPIANEYLANLELAGKYNQFTADKPRIKHFNEFMKGVDVSFQDITPGLLDKFIVYLKNYHVGKKNKKPMGQRTMVNHLVTIRSVFTFARRNKHIQKGLTPFGGDDGIKIKFPDSKKVGITAEDVYNLEELRLENPRHDHARKIWLFAFYFAGMRISDIFQLRWSDFQNSRLHYSMGKNDKVDSLKIPDKAAAILLYYEQFKETENDLVFPELKDTDPANKFVVQRTIAFKTSALDKFLRKYVAPAAGITAKLTMHTSRHTFGDLAGDAVPIQMLQKLYRHSHVSTTIGYQANFIKQAADDALDSVLDKTSASRISPD